MTQLKLFLFHLISKAYLWAYQILQQKVTIFSKAQFKNIKSTEFYSDICSHKTGFITWELVKIQSCCLSSVPVNIAGLMKAPESSYPFCEHQCFESISVTHLIRQHKNLEHIRELLWLCRWIVQYNCHPKLNSVQTAFAAEFESKLKSTLSRTLARAVVAASRKVSLEFNSKAPDLVH